MQDTSNMRSPPLFLSPAVDRDASWTKSWNGQWGGGRHYKLHGTRVFGPHGCVRAVHYWRSKAGRVVVAARWGWGWIWIREQSSIVFYSPPWHATCQPRVRDSGGGIYIKQNRVFLRKSSSQIEMMHMVVSKCYCPINLILWMGIRPWGLGADSNRPLTEQWLRSSLSLPIGQRYYSGVKLCSLPQSRICVIPAASNLRWLAVVGNANATWMSGIQSVKDRQLGILSVLTAYRVVSLWAIALWIGKQQVCSQWTCIPSPRALESCSNFAV